MRLRWQNLNDKPGGRQGSGLLHGRAWLYIGKRYERCISAEWRLGGFKCGVGVSMHDEGPVAMLQIPLVGQFFVGLRGILPWALVHRFDWYDLSVRVFDWAIWVNLWCDDSRSRTYGSWWHPERRRVTWHLLDTLLGSTRYTSRVLKEVDAVVPMPEGPYPSKVTLREDTWRRPRWPFPKRLLRAEVRPETPIPHPGKGENAWDCGEDATRSLYTTAATVEDAVAAMVSTVLRSRRRHGGSVNWLPASARGQS
jgi:hypothetical protein